MKPYPPRRSLVTGFPDETISASFPQTDSTQIRILSIKSDPLLSAMPTRTEPDLQRTTITRSHKTTRPTDILYSMKFCAFPPSHFLPPHFDVLPLQSRNSLFFIFPSSPFNSNCPMKQRDQITRSFPNRSIVSRKLTLFPKTPSVCEPVISLVDGPHGLLLVFRFKFL